MPDEYPTIPNTYRFFVPPAALTDDHVTIDDSDLAHQMGRVLRLRPGSRVLLLDGQGTACSVRLTAVERARIAGLVEQRTPATGEPPLHLTLAVALIRAERFEWVLQKGTELGAGGFLPLHCQRSLAADQANPRRRQRWERIIREAAEQSCRGRLPNLEPPQPFVAACAWAARADLALLLWEGRAAPPLRDLLRTRPTPPATLVLLSGPEGGIAPEELTTATEHGIIPVSLGPRILRAETAPIAALAAVLYEYGEPGTARSAGQEGHEH